MKRILTITKALSDRNRLRSVMALAEFRELCACQITELLQVSGATASRHLSLLVNAGLMENRKEGRWVFYRLNDSFSRGPVIEWLKHELEHAEDLKSDRDRLKKILTCTPEELCRKQRGIICCPKD